MPSASGMSVASNPALADRCLEGKVARDRPLPVAHAARAAHILGELIRQATAIQKYARKLLAVHGDKAIAEAAQKAKAYEQHDDREEAKTWRRIEAALRQMQGPHAS